MNKAGLDYCNFWERRLQDEFDKKTRASFSLTYTNIEFLSKITERIMRLGIESRIYELEDDELERVARASLIESYYKAHINEPPKT